MSASPRARTPECRSWASVSSAAKRSRARWLNLARRPERRIFRPRTGSPRSSWSRSDVLGWEPVNRAVAALAVLAGLAIGVPAGAQALTPETIQSGYRLFYQGDTAAAIKHFQGLLTSTPNDLPARFGLLFAQEESLNTHPETVASFEKSLDALINLADVRYGRNKQDDEALFYLAQAYFLRAEYRFDHDKGMLGAARDGAHAKNLIETYVKRHPDHGDAYFVLGLYDYYVELVPSFVKMFRFLLFLPAGNRVDGLKQIERAAAQGT